METICQLALWVKGAWVCIKEFDDVKRAQQSERSLNNIQIDTCITCACGRYAFGGCPTCSPDIAAIHSQGFSYQDVPAHSSEEGKDHVDACQ